MSLKIEASTRLMAAEADEAKAEKFLKTLGFTGLSLKSAKEDQITFHYKSCDEEKLEKKLGEPKSTGGAGNLRYPAGSSGVVSIWTDKQEVVLKNSKRGK